MKHRAKLELLRRLNASEDTVRTRAMAEAKALSMRELLEISRTLQRHVSAASALESVGGVVPLYLVLVALVWLVWQVVPDGLRRNADTAFRSLSQLIETCEDPGALGTLLVEYHHFPTKLHSACFAFLTRAISDLDEAGYQRLGREAQSWMTYLLQSRIAVAPYVHVDLSVAVLRVLGDYADPRKGTPRIDDPGNGVPRYQVETLAKGPRATPKMTQVSDAARQALARMDERAKLLEKSQTLLRASSAPDQPETLLRASMPATHSTPPEQLVRPSSPDQPDPVTKAGSRITPDTKQTEQVLRTNSPPGP